VVARAILGIGAVAWAVGCLAAIVVAVVGVDRLMSLLPPLQVDAEAVRGAVIAVAGGLAVATAAHVAVLAGMRAHRRRAWSAGILLAALLCAAFVALTAAAFTSAVVASAPVALLAVAGAAAAVVAIGYAVATVRLVGELRVGAGG
jgi:heme/copper-type cytochrome/quinol oxidase subunit 3